MTDRPMISCENLVKIYRSAELEVVALQGLDLSVAAAEMIAIIGNSGSGKSTLLNILGGLDRPSAGSVEVNGRLLARLADEELAEYRTSTVGFVWQNNARNLIPYLTATENVEIPLSISKAGASARSRREKARELLDLVGLSHRTGARLAELSGGEQQRVAIAIGLANQPKVLLADEPTGNVDSVTAAMLLDVFNAARRAYGTTVVVVTHDARVARAVDRVVAIRDGRPSSELVNRGAYAEEFARLRGSLDADDAPAEELLLVDKAGRVQIPRELLDSAGIEGKARADLRDGRIVLERPGEKGEPGEQGGGAV
jgi:ABC-type lipoprotein export system ATPase subunit